MSRMTLLHGRAADGCPFCAFDEGEGEVILLCHAGMDDGRQWAAVAAQLSSEFRVLRLQRRRYRMDLPRPSASFDHELADIAAILEMVPGPILIVRHSSGAILALEALLRAPARYAGAVLYEPPCPIDRPLGEETRYLAETALGKGRLRKAVGHFLTGVVGLRRHRALPISLLLATVPAFRRWIPRQIDDWQAINSLGMRLDAYRHIPTPVLLLGGGQSPAHLANRLDALAQALPNVERTTVLQWSHLANLSAPEAMARLIAAFALGCIGSASGLTLS